MRIIFSVVFILLILALVICAYKAYHSHRRIGKSVSLLLTGLIPPVAGNLIIICSGVQAVSTVGFYIYFLGMDFVIFALFWFAFDYCHISRKNRNIQYAVIGILVLDAVQLLCNPVFGQAFGMEAVQADGSTYFRLIPYFGQTLHRIVDYGILFLVLLIFAVKTIRSSRFDSERYFVILLAMVITTVWETYYIFISRSTVDRSMIGFGVFGLLVYYFSILYRPMRLLDRMLAGIASELPEALFFFDVNGRCIWANRLAGTMTGISEEDYEPSVDRLTGLFGPLDVQSGWTAQRETGRGEAQKSYVLEAHVITDGKGRPAGSFLSIRDNTNEQKTLQREMYKATHDSLTDTYNRAGYDLLLTELDPARVTLLLMDVDHFKEVNDTYGHETGDKVLRRTADVIRHHFRSMDHVCRIGGDEFVVLVRQAGEKVRKLIAGRVRNINEELSRTEEGVPAITLSAGIAVGQEGITPEDLFSQADAAMYETKRRGRNGFTFYGQDTSAMNLLSDGETLNE